MHTWTRVYETRIQLSTPLLETHFIWCLFHDVEPNYEK
jgi:hypothetical protein